jgi:hypothetical protein
VVKNAMLYNKPNTKYHRTALRIQNALPGILEELQAYTTQHAVNADVMAAGSNAHENEDEKMEVESKPELPPVGDFEPPMDVLDILVSNEVIAEELPIIVPSDPITSLLNYELPVRKPSPSPPMRIKVGKARKRKAGAPGGGGEDGEGGDEERDNGTPIKSPLDDRDTFKFFETGWILPSDARRGGRAPPTPPLSQGAGTPASGSMSPAPSVEAGGPGVNVATPRKKLRTSKCFIYFVGFFS